MNIGDIVRLIAVLNNANGDAAVNVFTFLVTAVGTGLLSDLFDDFEAWLDDFYGQISANVAATVTSDSFDVMVRDAVAGQWNSVGGRTWTGFAGTALGDSSVDGMCPHLIGYPGLPRHRGSKFLPPVDENSISNGLLVPALAADLGIMLAKYISPLSEANLSANPGVYQESAEQFRGFAGSGSLSLIPAYQRRRKPGVGI